METALIILAFLSVYIWDQNYSIELWAILQGVIGCPYVYVNSSILPGE